MLQRLLQLWPGKKPSKPVVLFTAIESLLFTPDGNNKFASDDNFLFAMVMAEFNKFEIEVC